MSSAFTATNELLHNQIRNYKYLRAVSECAATLARGHVKFLEGISDNDALKIGNSRERIVRVLEYFEDANRWQPANLSDRRRFRFRSLRFAGVSSSRQRRMVVF